MYDALKTQLQHMKNSFDSFGSQTSSDIIQHLGLIALELSQMIESVQSQINQKSEEIAAMTVESARAITLDID
jgi:adenylosuccinate synthase